MIESSKLWKKTREDKCKKELEYYEILQKQLEADEFSGSQVHLNLFSPSIDTNNLPLHPNHGSATYEALHNLLHCPESAIDPVYANQSNLDSSIEQVERCKGKGIVIAIAMHLLHFLH